METGATTACRCVLSQKPGWNGTGRNGHTGLAATLACLERWEAGKMRGWKVLEGWMTMTDHSGRYMHTRMGPGLILPYVQHLPGTTRS